MSADFDELYTAHFGALVVQLRAFTGDLGEAQDVVQEAFCRAWGRWDRLLGYEDPAAWVRRVAWNIAVSRWRRRRIARNFLDGQRAETVSGPGPERVALGAARPGCRSTSGGRSPCTISRTSPPRRSPGTAASPTAPSGPGCTAPAPRCCST